MHGTKCKISTHHWNRRSNARKRGDQSRFREQIRTTHTHIDTDQFFFLPFIHISLNTLTNTYARAHICYPLRTAFGRTTTNVRIVFHFLDVAIATRERKGDRHNTEREILMCLISRCCVDYFASG